MSIDLEGQIRSLGCPRGFSLDSSCARRRSFRRRRVFHGGDALVSQLGRQVYRMSPHFAEALRRRARGRVVLIRLRGPSLGG